MSDSNVENKAAAPQVEATTAPAETAPLGGVMSAMVQKKLARRRADKGDAGAKADAPSSAPDAPDDRGAPPTAEVVSTAFSGAPSSLPHLADMERGFGRTLGHVRAYSDASARQASSTIGAHAFAFGNKIAFATPSPSKELVAHEVAHTIQQGGAGDAVQAKGEIDIAGDSFEQEADRAAAAVVSGGTAHVALRTGPGIQRKPSFGDDFDMFCDAVGLIGSGIWSGGKVANTDVYAKEVLWCLPPWLATTLAPSDKVHVVLDRTAMTATVTAGQLHASSLPASTMSTGPAGLYGMTITADLNTKVASVMIRNVQVVNPAFIISGTKVTAQHLDIDDLLVSGMAISKPGGFVNALGTMSMKALNVRHFAYPGMPPIDFRLTNLNASFEELPSVLIPPSIAAPMSALTGVRLQAPPPSLTSATPPPAGPAGTAGLPAAPGVFPPGSSLYIVLDGLTAGGADRGVRGWGAAGNGGLKLGKIGVLDAAQKPLASIEIRDFAAGTSNVAGPGGAVSGATIGHLILDGDPALIKTILNTPQLAAQPQVAAAADLIKTTGLMPSIGGKIDVFSVSIEDNTRGAPGQKIVADVDATFDDPQLGNLVVKVGGFHAESHPGAMTANFQVFTATLTLPDKKTTVSLVVNAPKQDAIHQDAKGTGADGLHFHLHGDVAHADALFKTLSRGVKGMPPELGAAFDVIRSFDLDADGTVDVMKTPDGKLTATCGDLQTTVDVPGVGKLAVGLTGFRGDKLGAAVGAHFDHFEATLTDAKHGEAAFISIDNPPETTEKPQDNLSAGKGQGAGVTASAGKFVVRGNPAVLIQSITERMHSLPPHFAAVLGTIQTLGVNGNASGGFSAHADRDGWVVEGGLEVTLSAKTAGKVHLKIDGVETHAGGGALGVRFGNFSASLVDPAGTIAASIAVDGNTSGDPSAPDQVSAKGHNGAVAAKSITVHGNPESLQAIVAALHTGGATLPPAMQTAVAFARAHAITGASDLTLKNVDVTEVDGKITANSKTDLDATVNAGDFGIVTIKVQGFQGAGSASSKELDHGSFDFFRASLASANGEPIASVHARGVSDANAKISPSGTTFNAQVRDVGVTGSSAHIDALIGTLERQMGSLPPGARAAFKAMRAYGINASGGVELTNAAFKSADGKTDASGDLGVHMVIPGGNCIDVNLFGFNGTLDNTTGLPIGAHFRQLVASIYAKGDAAREARAAGKPGFSPAKLVIDQVDEDGSKGKAPGDFSLHVGKVHAEGDGAQLSVMMAHLQQDVNSLPVPLRNALDTARGFAPLMSANGSIDMLETTYEKSDGKVSADGNFRVAFEVPGAGKVTLTATEFWMRPDNTAGVHEFEITIDDETSKAQAACLTVTNVEGSASVDLEKPAKVGTVSATGDTQRIAVALQAASGRQLPPQIQKAIAMIGSLNLDAKGLQLDRSADPDGGYVVQSSELMLGGNVNIVDSKQQVYRGTGVAIAVKSPKVKLGARFQPLDIVAGAIDVHGTFANGPNVAHGSLKLSSAHVTCDKDGNPLTIDAAGIQADVKADRGAIAADSFGGPGKAPANATAPAPSPTDAPHAPANAQPDAGIAMPGGREVVPLIDDVDINLVTPVHPGEWGAIEVVAGTNVHVSLKVRNNAIVAASTFATFGPKLRGPLFLRTGGGRLKQDGSGFDIVADLNGLGINITWIARHLGLMKKLPLDLQALYTRLLGTPAEEAAAADRAAKQPAHVPSAREQRNAQRTAQREASDAKDDRDSLAREHASWQHHKDGVWNSVDGKFKALNENASSAKWSKPWVARYNAAKTNDERVEINKQLRASPEGRKFEADWEATWNNWKRDMATEDTREPMSHHAADLFTLKGFELGRTQGDVDLKVSSPKPGPTTLSKDITLPAGGSTHFHGAIDGSGDMTLTADNLGATVRVNNVDNHVDVAGVRATVGGDFQTDRTGKSEADLEVISLGIDSLHWDAAKPGASPDPAKKTAG